MEVVVSRSLGLSVGADAGEFPLAHVVAFQYTILRTVSRGNGFHGDGNFNA